MAKYNKVLQTALNQQPINDCKLTDAEIETEIAKISTCLKGPMSNTERLLLVADRSELRATLAKRSELPRRG